MILSFQARVRKKVDKRIIKTLFHGVRIRERMVREIGSKKRNILDSLDMKSWEEAIYLHVCYFSS